VSSYLQEKLQRERKVELERSSSRMSSDMSASLELPRASQSSPVRSGTSDGRRPRSSGNGEAAKKKGMVSRRWNRWVAVLSRFVWPPQSSLLTRRLLDRLDSP
jgi:hypothetical protein